MCGIVGYIGKSEKKSLLLKALKELEYRGYDSAGFSVIDNDNLLHTFKASGRIDELARAAAEFASNGDGVGIAHTRWATHGEPSTLNSHPHNGSFSSIIHNGIIENFAQLRGLCEGAQFASETDTEVVVHLFEREFRRLAAESTGAADAGSATGDGSADGAASSADGKALAVQAFSRTIAQLRGAFAILLITEKAPGTVFFAANHAPLSVARTDSGEVYFASCDAPLVGLCESASYLNDGDFGYADAAGVHFLRGSYEPQPIAAQEGAAGRADFATYMEKEIYEQAFVAEQVILGRIAPASDATDAADAAARVQFAELAGLADFEQLIICACGTSFHAALAASYLFERAAHIPCRVEIASEFRYKRGILPPRALFVCLSQSGETADTLEALKIAKAAGLATLALVNVRSSSIARTADRVIMLRAGIEKSVASTKAFCAQMLTLWLLSLALNRNAARDAATELAAICELPRTLSVEPALHSKIKRLSKRYLHGHGFFFIGRDVFYPLALEAALKLKEISYLHAEGYAAGEMKHGPIALADAELFTMAFMPRGVLAEKTASNVLELAARDATILAIGPDEFSAADDWLRTREHDFYMSEFFEMMVVMQLFALEIATRLGLDVDMPRNLAKSVTVE